VGSPHTVPPLCERRVGLVGHLVGEQREMVCEGAVPPTRMRLWTPATRAAPPLPACLDKDATDTQAYGNRTLCLSASFSCLDDTIT
jgi:hypothetical protein